jgi:hypothetical protein
VSFYVDRNGKVVVETSGYGGKDKIEENIKKTIASGGSASVAGQSAVQVAGVSAAVAGGR